MGASYFLHIFQYITHACSELSRLDDTAGLQAAITAMASQSVGNGMYRLIQLPAGMTRPALTGLRVSNQLGVYRYHQPLLHDLRRHKLPDHPRRRLRPQHRHEARVRPRR